MEQNLIQAPELIRRLTRLFGLVQAHVAPTLLEGVQAVAIIADVRSEVGNIVPTYTKGGLVNGDAIVGGPALKLWNPVDSGVWIKPIRLYWGVVAGIGAQTTQQFRLETSAFLGELGNLDGAGQQQGLQMRYGTGSLARRSRGRVSIGGGAGASDIFWTWNIPLTQIQGMVLEFKDDLDLFIPPGLNFVVTHDDADSFGGYVSIQWQEHPGATVVAQGTGGIPI